MKTKLVPVPSHSLNAALDFVRKGGRLLVPSMTRCTVIDAKVLSRFEKAGVRVLWEDGETYRVAVGRKSVYLLPGQLKYEMES